MRTRGWPQNSSTRKRHTRGLKNSQTARMRQPRVRVGALAPQAQNWHNSGTTLGKMAGHLVQRIDAPATPRARVDDTFLKNDAYAPSMPTRGGSFC